jgi:hypothetical protein
MDTSQRKSPIRLTAVGIEERMRNTMQLFFLSKCKNQYILGDEASAEIAIIDLDGYGATRRVSEYRERHPGQPVILISVNDYDSKEDLFLKKPLKTTELLDAINRLSAQIHSLDSSSAAIEAPNNLIADEMDNNTIGEDDVVAEPSVATNERNKNVVRLVMRGNPTASNAASLLDKNVAKTLIGTVQDIDPTDAGQVSKIQYNPQNFFYGHFQRAAAQADSMKIDIKIETPSGSLIYRADTQQVITSIGHTHLRTLSSVPMSGENIKIKTLGRGELEAITDKHSVLGKESFLWQISLWAARGRLPQGTVLTEPVSLRRWPNMTRLTLFPNAVRIAALWNEHPQSLIDTSLTLGIPQRYVFAFYSAVHAIGLVDINHRDAKPLIKQAPPPLKTEQRNLFGKIMQHLRLHKENRNLAIA